MESITRFRDDVILRTALDETLDLFGDENKKILLYTISIEKNETERITVRDREGYLDYDRVTRVIKSIFNEHASQFILDHLDRRRKELAAAAKTSASRA